MDLHVSNHALGTKKKPYTSLTCEDLVEYGSGGFYNERHQDDFEAVNARTLTTVPKWLSQRISDGSVTEPVSVSDYMLTLLTSIFAGLCIGTHGAKC